MKLKVTAQHKHSTNERRVRKPDKKARRDLILDNAWRWRERGQQRHDVQRKPVPQMRGCERKCSVADGGQPGVAILDLPDRELCDSSE